MSYDDCKVEQGEPRLAIGMHCRPGYVVCGCGAWNTVDQRTECYMCHKPLYAAAASLPDSQPAPEMDYEREVEAFRYLCNTCVPGPSHRTCIDRQIAWLRAHDARVQPEAAPHDGACDYCGCIPTIAMPTYFCDECSKKAMKWADSQPSSVAGTDRLQRINELLEMLRGCAMQGRAQSYVQEIRELLAESALKESSHGK